MLWPKAAGRIIEIRNWLKTCQGTKHSFVQRWGSGRVRGGKNLQYPPLARWRALWGAPCFIPASQQSARGDASSAHARGRTGKPCVTDARLLSCTPAERIHLPWKWHSVSKDGSWEELEREGWMRSWGIHAVGDRGVKNPDVSFLWLKQAKQHPIIPESAQRGCQGVQPSAAGWSGSPAATSAPFQGWNVLFPRDWQRNRHTSACKSLATSCFHHISLGGIS